MIFGRVCLFCPICGCGIVYDQNKSRRTMHTREFGVICGKACFDLSELKYARMIMGKDDPDLEPEQFT